MSNNLFLSDIRKFKDGADKERLSANTEIMNTRTLERAFVATYRLILPREDGSRRVAPMRLNRAVRLHNKLMEMSAERFSYRDIPGDPIREFRLALERGEIVLEAERRHAEAEERRFGGLPEPLQRVVREWPGPWDVTSFEKDAFHAERFIGRIRLCATCVYGQLDMHVDLSGKDFGDDLASVGPYLRQLAADALALAGEDGA